MPLTSRALGAVLLAFLACVACQPQTPVAPPTQQLTPGPAVAGRPQTAPTFGPAVFPTPRALPTRLPDSALPGATPTPTSGTGATPTPTPVPTATPATGGPTSNPSAGPTLPPPPGVQAYDLPALGVNVSTIHGGKGPGNSVGALLFMRFNTPVGLAYDSSAFQRLYIADSLNHVIRRSDVEELPDGGKTRIGSTHAGVGIAGFLDGPDFQAKFNTPRGVCTGALSESIFVVDSLNHCIRRVMANPNSDDKTIYVTRVAGSLQRGHKDAVGLDAEFDEPWGIARDSASNLYVTDTNNHCIRKITPAFVVTTLAGIPGSSGFSDGAVAPKPGEKPEGKLAQFASPKGIWVNANGEIYVCDTGNHCIRKIDTSGRVTTIAGSTTGERGFRNGKGTEALFDTPIAIVQSSDASTFYVSDYGNNRIRVIRVDDKTHVVSNFAGTGGAGDLDGPGNFASFRAPQGLAIDGQNTAAGDLFVIEEGNHAVRKVTLERVVSTEFGSQAPGADDGRLSLASFRQPFGIALAKDGTFYIADTLNHTIRRATKDGVVTTFAGKAGERGKTDGASGTARFDTPRGVAVDAAGNVYVADEGNHMIRKITPAGTVSTIAGNGEVKLQDGPALESSFNTPRGIAVGPDGKVYVADFGNNAIRVIADGRVAVFAGSKDGKLGRKDGEAFDALFAKPSGVSVSKDNKVYVADFGNNAIRLIQDDGAGKITVGTLAGAALANGNSAPGFDDGPGGTAKFNDPWGLVVDDVGRVFVADYGNCLIRKINPDGSVSTYAGNYDNDFQAPVAGYRDGSALGARFAAPAGVVIDELGYVYVADTENNCIRRIH